MQRRIGLAATLVAVIAWALMVVPGRIRRMPLPEAPRHRGSRIPEPDSYPEGTFSLPRSAAPGTRSAPREPRVEALATLLDRARLVQARLIEAQTGARSRFAAGPVPGPETHALLSELTGLERSLALLDAQRLSLAIDMKGAPPEIQDLAQEVDRERARIEENRSQLPLPPPEAAPAAFLRDPKQMVTESAESSRGDLEYYRRQRVR